MKEKIIEILNKADQNQSVFHSSPVEVTKEILSLIKTTLLERIPDRKKVSSDQINFIAERNIGYNQALYDIKQILDEELK